jgi:hypothetical protein
MLKNFPYHKCAILLDYSHVWQVTFQLLGTRGLIFAVATHAHYSPTPQFFLEKPGGSPYTARGVLLRRGGSRAATVL